MKIIELIVVIFILGVVFTMLVSVFSNYRSAGYLIEAETQIIGILRDARSRTLASQGNKPYGVHFEETKAVLYVADVAYDQNASTNEVYMLPAGVRISGGAGTNIVYTQLTGIPMPSGAITIQLRSDPAQTKTINVSATGVIN